MGTWVLQQVTSIDWNWNHESYPDFRDFSVIPFFALFFPSLRFLLDTFLFEQVARRLIFGKGHKKMDFQTLERKKKISKFKESAWKCVYFLSAEIFALAVTYDEPWFTDTRLKLKVLYMYAAGFYTYSILALVFWETKRSDFVVSMGHHVITVILIVLSYIFRFVRVGSVVLALHDASDVFIETGKMSKYSGAETTASIAFILFVLCFTVTRIIYYPFWILRSTSYEVVHALKMDLVDGPLYYYVFNSLLYFLQVLHIYWWVLMLRMLVKQIQEKGKVSEDIRSDSEDEDEHKHEE
ncbi:hypothetical protein JHK85_004117 [Glycine max]|nr:hypothetical protein JHK85_004117 [Glycine max]